MSQYRKILCTDGVDVGQPGSPTQAMTMCRDTDGSWAPPTVLQQKHGGLYVKAPKPTAPAREPH